jgi:hypothetical protein
MQRSFFQPLTVALKTTTLGRRWTRFESLVFKSTRIKLSSYTKLIFAYDMVAKTESILTRIVAKSSRDVLVVASYFNAIPQQKHDQPMKSFDRMAI